MNINDYEIGVLCQSCLENNWKKAFWIKADNQNKILSNIEINGIEDKGNGLYATKGRCRVENVQDESTYDAIFRVDFKRTTKNNINIDVRINSTLEIEPIAQ